MLLRRGFACVGVLIISVKAERVPAKYSARKESSEDDSQSEARDVCVAIWGHRMFAN